MSSPLVRLASGTSDASGNLTLKFQDSPPVGQTWTGMVSASASPSGAIWQASVSGVPWATGVGAAAFGPVQLLGNMSLTVAGSGLVPNTLYSVYLQGVVDNAADAVPVWPNLPSLPPAYTGPALLDRSDTIAALGSLTYPFLTCGQWQSVAIHCQSGAAQSQLNFDWFDTPSSAGILLGSRIIVVDSGLNADLTVPNLGPYLRITATTYVNPATVTLIVAMSSRIGRAWSPTALGPIIDVQDVTLLAGASQTFSANYTYGGPAYATAIRDVSSFQFILNALELAGNAHHLLDWDTSTGPLAGNQNTDLLLPPMRLQVTIKNSSAGTGHFSFTLVGDIGY